MIVWMTTGARIFGKRAVVIAALMVFLLAYAPSVAKPDGRTWHRRGAEPRGSGFANRCRGTGGSSVFIASAMTATGWTGALRSRCCRWGKTHHIVIGAMVVGFLLSFIVPPAPRPAWPASLPIMMGFVLAFRWTAKSRFAAPLVITTAQTASIWNVGIKTAAAIKHAGHRLY